MADDELPLAQERHGEVALLRLDLPQRLNPFTVPLQQALREALAALREDRSVRALVLTGAGRAFCVGADLSSMQPQSGERLGAEQAARWGLVWDCVDDGQLPQAALALAERLACLPAHAALEVRRLYDSAAAQDLPAQLQLEAQRQRELIDRPSFAEGVQAFLDKREPRFASR